MFVMFLSGLLGIKVWEEVMNGSVGKEVKISVDDFL